jgi:hypothetical protein
MTDKTQPESQNNSPSTSKMDPQNNPCSLCRPFRVPVCPGHGGSKGGSGSGSSGGGESGGDNSQSGNSQENSSTAHATHTPETTNHATNTDSNIGYTNTYTAQDISTPQNVLSKNMLFNSEVISELLSKKLLSLDSNNDLGILSIKCNPELLSKDQKNEIKKFIDVLLKELEAFKKEKGLSVDAATIDKDPTGNIISLRITLPKPAIYDAFIQRLVNKNLLPLQAQQKNEKAIYQEDVNHFHPTPLSMKPTPKTDKKDDEKKSTIRPKSPLDGLKPKGWK